MHGTALVPCCGSCGTCQALRLLLRLFSHANHDAPIDAELEYIRSYHELDLPGLSSIHPIWRRAHLACFGRQVNRRLSEPFVRSF